MFHLPLPLVYEICLYLDKTDRQSLRCTSRTYHELITDETMWKYYLVSQGLNYLTLHMSMDEVRQVLKQGVEDWRRFKHNIQCLEQKNVTLLRDEEGNVIFPDLIHSYNTSLTCVEDFDSCPNDVMGFRMLFVPRSIHSSDQEHCIRRNYPVHTMLMCSIQYCDPDYNCDSCQRNIIRLQIERREYINGICSSTTSFSLDEIKEHMLTLEREKVIIGKIPLKYRELSE